MSGFHTVYTPVFLPQSDIKQPHLTGLHGGKNDHGFTGGDGVCDFSLQTRGFHPSAYSGLLPLEFMHKCGQKFCPSTWRPRLPTHHYASWSSNLTVKFQWPLKGLRHMKGLCKDMPPRYGFVVQFLPFRYLK